MSKIKRLVFSFIGVGLIAAISGYFTRFGVESWYKQAVPSALTPPDISFRIIWSILYFMMAVAVWKISEYKLNEETRLAKNWFWLQLLLHIPWCFAFFYLGWLWLGLAVILLMDYAAFRTIQYFGHVSKTAAYMLWPYFVWISYATILNLAYIVNNGLVIKVQ